MTDWRNRPLLPADNQVRLSFCEGSVKLAVAERYARIHPDLSFDPERVTLQISLGGKVSATAVGLPKEVKG
ncbi:hypothetical protein V8J36_05475 [Frigidibacter sp. MR17.14]|uniref:hypothetical protein n=1 Tax=Frigidibacter sp. MR17.14 TaxID=3126509 RepID=UPI003012AC99